MIRRFDPAAGGPPVVCGHMAAAEGRYGHTSSVLTEAANGFPGHARVVAVGSVPATAALFPTAARHAIGDALAGADLAHLHGVWDSLLVAAARQAHRCGIPYIVHPHGMLDPWSLAQRKWKKRLALALGVRWVLDRAAFIRALNRDEAELLRPLRLAPPVRVIPNGIELSDLAPAPGELHQAVPTLGDRPYVLFLGRLHPKKGLDLLADAFARVAAAFPDLQLLVAGANDGARADFVARVEAASLSARVHLPGPLYGAAKWAALAGAACFCLPSRQEGFSVAVLEALASRVPVVISTECHFPEVAEAGAGVVTALSAQAVADGLMRVLTDPAAARAMGVAGRQLVETRYSWTQVGAQCEALARDATAHREARDGN